MQPTLAPAVAEVRTASEPRHRAALVLLCFASFMMILDSQIVILALPSIQKGLALSAGQVQWILTANAVTFGGLLLLGGRAADLLGRRRMFIIGLAGFLVTSLVSGLAWNGGILIAARALHGVSAALMVPSALSILMNTFREGRERNRAIASWSAVGGVGATVGLLLGGVLTTGLGWQWVFLVNVPVVLAVLVAAPFVLHESRDEERRRTFDVAGAVTITVALVALVYALVDAPAAGWASLQTIGLLVLVVALVGLFVAVEARSAAPLVPLRLLRMRTVVTGNMMMAVVAMLAWGEGVLISLYTQQVLGYSAMESGITSSVMPVMAVAGAYIGQSIVTRRGFRVVAAVSAVALGLGCLLLSRVPVEGHYFRDIFLALAVFGLGLGAGNTTSSIVALTGVSKPESGLASGLNAASFQIGGAIGVAIVTTVAVSVTAGSTSLPALTNGFQAGFGAGVVIAIVAVVVAFLLPRRRRLAGTGPDEVVEAPVTANINQPAPVGAGTLTEDDRP